MNKIQFEIAYDAWEYTWNFGPDKEPESLYENNLNYDDEDETEC